MGGGAPGKRYVLTVIDHFSRYINYYPITSRTAESVIKSLNEFVDYYGPPRTLLTDNAREFCSGTVRQWCDDNGIKLVHFFDLIPPTR